MATLRVYYFGLIAHIDKGGSDKKESAAIVRNDHHIPLIVFHDYSSFRVLAPEVQKLTFGDQRPAGADPLFKSFVPTLSKIMKGKLRPNNDDKSIELGYPGAGSDESLLSVVQLYQERALYENTIDTYVTCVARITVATITTNGPIVVTAKNKTNQTLWTETIMLDTDKCVLVGNIPTQGVIAAIRKVSVQLVGLRVDTASGEHGSNVAAGDHPEEHPHEAPDAAASTAHHAVNHPPEIPGTTAPSAHHGAHVKFFGELLDEDLADKVTVTELPNCGETVGFVGCDWVRKLVDTLGYHFYSGDTVECGNTQWP